MAKLKDITVNMGNFVSGFEITKGMSRDLGNAVIPLARQNVETAARAEYATLMRNLRQKLAPGGMQQGSKVVAGGTYPLSFTRSDGSRGQIRATFKALTTPYVRRKPESRRFWYKTGTLFERWTKLRAPTVRVTEMKASRNHHKGMVNTKFELRFSPLPPALRQLQITESFVNAAEIPVPRVNPGWRRGLGRALIAEIERPWMRTMAAAIGKDLRKNLRKI